MKEESRLFGAESILLARTRLLLRAGPVTSATISTLQHRRASTTAVWAAASVHRRLGCRAGPVTSTAIPTLPGR